MKKLIQKKTPIDVDLSPNRNIIYSGVGLKLTDKIYIFVNFNRDTKEFDGYAIIRSFEIKMYREWSEEELNDIKNNNLSDYLGKLPLLKMNNMFESLSELKKENILISVFIAPDDDSFYVGKIFEISKKTIELKLLSEEAEWLYHKTINIDDITYIGFDSSYEKSLNISDGYAIPCNI